jgi:sulfur-oxidizing protein SoxY
MMNPPEEAMPALLRVDQAATPGRAELDRRRLVQLGLATGVTLAGHWPLRVLAQPAADVGAAMKTAIRAWTAGASPSSGRVEIDIAELIDNGNAVPVTLRVASPMTPADHVTGLALFAERNPLPDVVAFSLGPRAGRAEVSTRIRLATSQQLVAIARMHDGTFWQHSVKVIVTLAACVEDPLEGG